MHQLPVHDTINLFGIPQSMLRATALALRSTAVDSFLEVMRHIISGADMDRRRFVPAATTTAGSRPQATQCRNCGKKGHIHKKKKRIKQRAFIAKSPGTDSMSAQIKIREQRRDSGHSQGLQWWPQQSPASRRWSRRRR